MPSEARFTRVQRGTVKSGFLVFYLNGLFGGEMRLFKSEAFQVLVVQSLSPATLQPHGLEHGPSATVLLQVL